MFTIDRVDERDIMFSRMGYKPGTPQHDDYYGRKPERKQQDDLLRSMPDLGTEGTPTFDPVNSPIVNATFAFLADIKKYAEGVPASQQARVDPEVISRRLKGLAEYYGAKLVGITELQDHHYYSHRGRNVETYGQEVTEFHRYAIAFAVEMNRDMIFRAPQVPEGIAVTKGYVDAAIIGMVLSYYIRQLGYEARNHMDGNYLVVAPLVAQAAGLGEIGRSGILITKEFGPRVRLGVVTTDIPLTCDKPVSFGLTQFCTECGRCAKVCPAKAIPAEDQQDINGVRRWQINQERCFHNWKLLGGDCGICLAACPFSSEIPPDQVEKIATSQDVRNAILRDYQAKHGARAKAQHDPDWLR